MSLVQSRKLGIDLGTTRTRIWYSQTGKIIDEPTCLAVDTKSQKVVAVGQEAKNMIGRVSEHIQILFPIQHGRVVDRRIALAYLKVMMQRVIPAQYFFRPATMVALPAGSTQVDREIITELLYDAGANEVFTITQPLAAAIGADVPVADASGSFILHMGGGVVETSMISFGSVVQSNSILQGGNYADNLIKQLIAKNHNLEISLQQAEKIKLSIGSLSKTGEKMLISGQSYTDQIPVEIEIKAYDVQQALLPLAIRYTRLIKDMLEKLPPSLVSDLIDKGMLLSGSLAQLDGLDKYLISQVGVPVALVEEPDLVVIKGVANVLKHIDLYKESLSFLNQA